MTGVRDGDDRLIQILGPSIIRLVGPGKWLVTNAAGGWHLTREELWWLAHYGGPDALTRP